MIKTMQLTDVTSKNGIFVLIYGVPGAGKTASIRNFPQDKTAIICSEQQGLVTLSRMGWKEAKVLCPRTFEEFVSATEECLGDGSIDHILVDTASQIYDLFWKSYTEGKEIRSIGLDAYRFCGLQFQRIFRRMLDALPMGKNLICTVHLKYREERDGDNSKNIREPDLPGQLPQFVARTASLVLRADRIKMGQTIRYVLACDGTEGSYAKDVLGLMGDGIKENDLWSIIQPVLSTRQPIATVAQAAKEEEVPSYAALLKLANAYKIRKQAVDAWLTRISFDMAKPDANWQEAIDAWKKEFAPF